MFDRLRRPLIRLGGGLLMLGLLAGGFALLNELRLERVLEARFGALHDEGVLPVAPSPSDQGLELTEARAALDELLTRVQRADTLLTFGATGMLDSTDPEGEPRIAEGLRARADLLADLDALPDALWDAEGEPFDPRAFLTPAVRGGDSLGALHSTTNLMCAAAWLHAREPDGGVAAGAWLGRSLALARITDGGGASELGLRVLLERIAIDCFEGLVEEGIVDPMELAAPVRAELERFDDAARLRLLLRCDLARYEVMQDVLRRPLLGIRGVRMLLDEVLWRRELLDDGFDEGWRDLAGRGPNDTAESEWMAHFAKFLGMREGLRQRALGNG